MTEKHFPNGFPCWQETHFEVVSYMTGDINNNPGGVVETLRSSDGTGALWQLAEDLTDEFEKLNKNREWDGEFFDEIEKFMEEKLKELVD
jgi:hypothetical protein